jgi:hypothetical protein
MQPALYISTFFNNGGSTILLKSTSGSKLLIISSLGRSSSSFLPILLDISHKVEITPIVGSNPP